MKNGFGFVPKAVFCFILGVNKILELLDKYDRP